MGLKNRQEGKMYTVTTTESLNQSGCNFFLKIRACLSHYRCDIIWELRADTLFF